MVVAETTSGVMVALLSSLQAVSGPEPEKTMQIVEAVIARGLNYRKNKTSFSD
jgi:hypothetical protein